MKIASRFLCLPELVRFGKNEWKVETTTEEDRQFLQTRLARMARVLFLIDLVFTLALLVLVFGVRRFAGANFASNLGTALAVALMLALTWWITATRRLSSRLLFIVELLLFASISVLLGVSAYLGWDVEPQRYGVVIGGILTSVGRVFFVPSTWQRTAFVSGLLSLGPVAGILARAWNPMAHTNATVDGPLSVAVLWGTTSILLTSAGSRVLFGLRREIRRARALGQYELSQKLGEGGMGEVYLAHHRMLRRPTAIKLLPSHKAGTHAVDRFEQEVRLTATLNHPNTVSVYDYGRSGDGIFYYAMEYVHGLSLSALVVRDGPQPVDRTVNIVRQVALSLREAHGKGLVHRDVKPANILLTERGGELDFVKVVDFGLVKNLSMPGGLTEVDNIAGTPAYLAPEMLTDPSAVDGRTDLYALAAVGYFLLTGHDVFEGNNVVEVLSQHIHDAPRPPSERLGRPLSAQLEELLLHCLSKRPQERPRDVEAFLDALAAVPRAEDWSFPQARLWWDSFEQSPRVQDSSSFGATRTISVQTPPSG